MAACIFPIDVWDGGRRGEGATAADRVGVGVDSRLGPSFMVSDAATLSWARGDVLGSRLSRAEALASPLRLELFAMLDRLVEDDARLRDFYRGAASS